MTYVAPGPRHLIQEVTYNAASQVLTCNAEVNGVLVTPTGTPTCAIYNNGGDTALSSGNCGGSAGSMTYSFSTTATNTFVLQQIYRAVFSFVSGGVTYQREVVFLVVRVVTEDACPINLNDLKGMHERVDQAITQTGQTSDAVNRYLETAYEEVRETLMSQGVHVHEVNPLSLKMATKYMAATNIAIGFLKAAGDAWTVVLSEWKERYAASMARMVIISREADSLTVTEQRGKSQPALLIGNDTDMNIAGPFGWSRNPPGWPR